MAPWLVDVAVPMKRQCRKDSIAIDVFRVRRQQKTVDYRICRARHHIFLPLLIVLISRTDDYDEMSFHLGKLSPSPHNNNNHSQLAHTSTQPQIFTFPLPLFALSSDESSFTATASQTRISSPK